MQSTINGSQRSSSATSYLAPNFLQRPNLDVLLNAQVSRILQTSDDNGRNSAFRDVEFRVTSGGNGKELLLVSEITDILTLFLGRLQRLTAAKEVVLCAGTVGTPHVLLNSGIGNANNLKTVGVKSIVNLPDVGENLADHSLIASPWLVRSVSLHMSAFGRYAESSVYQNDTFEPFLREPAVQQKEISEWVSTGQGPLVNTISNHLGFFRLPKSNPIFNRVNDPTSGPITPHYEFLISVCGSLF